MYLPPDLITLSFAKKIRSLRPYGEGFKEPIFFSDGIERITPKLLKDNKHFSQTIMFKNGKNVSGISFNAGQFAGLAGACVKGGVFYRMEVDTYMGEKVKLNVVDFCEYNSDFVFDPNSTYGLSRDDLATLYSQLKKLGNTFTFGDVSKMRYAILNAENVGNEIKNRFTWFKTVYGIKIFVELGYIK